jgi:hypothetical protein
MSEHAAMFRQCLIDIDVKMMRQLWQHVAPHLPQPHSDAECLETIHRARVEMTTLPVSMRDYSSAWLAEHAPSRDAFAVGIAVKAASSPNPYYRRRGVYVQHEMSYAVEQALGQGIGLEDPKDAAEVKRRIMLARDHA